MKKQMLKSALIALAGVGLMAGGAMAGSIDYTFDNTDVYKVASINSNVLAQDMVGMEILVTFTGGSTQTYTWNSLAVGGYGFEIIDGSGDAGFRLQMATNANTFSATWYSNVLVGSDLSIDKIRFDGVSGKVVFDIWEQAVGTAGSDDGLLFSSTTFDNDLHITYAEQVALGNSNPVGDLYRYLTIDFDGDYGAGNRVYFKADTDKFAPVPEPATMLLFGTGLAGLAGIARRRKAE